MEMCHFDEHHYDGSYLEERGPYSYLDLHVEIHLRNFVLGHEDVERENDRGNGGSELQRIHAKAQDLEAHASTPPNRCWACGTPPQQWEPGLPVST